MGLVILLIIFTSAPKGIEIMMISTKETCSYILRTRFVGQGIFAAPQNIIILLLHHIFHLYQRIAASGMWMLRFQLMMAMTQTWCMHGFHIKQDVAFKLTLIDMIHLIFSCVC